MDHESGELNYGNWKKTTEQGGKGCSETAGEFEAARGENGARSTERAGVQIIDRHTESEQYSDESAAAQETRVMADEQG
jgi:hypothetical protein